MVENKTDKVLGNLPKYMKRETTSNNYNFVKSYSDELDVFDINSTELKSNIQISTSTGTSLDDIGELFGITRVLVETDGTYRSRILAYWGSLLGGGTYASIKQSISSALSISTTDITITDISVALFEIDIPINDETTLELMNTLSSIVEDIKAAGTKLKQFNFNSEDSIFRSNISEANGGDTIL